MKLAERCREEGTGKGAPVLQNSLADILPWPGRPVSRRGWHRRAMGGVDAVVDTNKNKFTDETAEAYKRFRCRVNKSNNMVRNPYGALN
jgi:hypothetical protein